MNHKNTSNADFAPEIKDIVKSKKSQDFIDKIAKLEGKNWYREIKTLYTNLSLDANKVVHKAASSLEGALSGKKIESELKVLKNHYQESFQEFEEEVFEKSEKVVDAILEYLSKAKENILDVMLDGPAAKQNLVHQHKAILDKSSPDQLQNSNEKEELKPAVVEKKEYSEEEKEELLLTKVTDIIHAGLQDTEIIPAIKEAYLDIYKKTLFAKTFYKMLGLSDKYLEELRKKKDLSIPVITLAVLIKKNPADDHAKADLEREIDNISNPSFQTEGENFTKPKINVVGHVKLSERDTNRFHKQTEKDQEVKQAPTTNPLESVGKKMTHQEFISACGLTYEEIRKHEMKGESMPARYLSYNKTPLKDKSIAHFFTIGEEEKGIHRVPINVFISQDPNKTFNEGEIYEVKVIGMLDSKKSGDKKQSKSVQGELVISEVESLGSGNFVGGAKGADKLKRIV